MDEQNVYGIKYEVDIEELKTSTAEATKKIRMANAEFNESASSMDNWATSVDGINAKIKQLNTILDAERSKLAKNKQDYNKIIDSISDYQKSIDELKAKKQQAIETYGEESNEVKQLNQQIAKLERQQTVAMNSADKLKVSIQNQQASVNRTEKSLKDYEGQLDEVKEAQKRAEKSGRSLEEELDDLRNASDEVENSMEGMSGGFSVVKGAIAGLIANGITSMISGLKSMAEESKEYMKIQGALTTSSKQAGYSAKETGETYKQLYGILGDDQTTATTVANIQALGLEQDKLTELTEGVIGAWTKYGDSIPIDGLAEAVNETVKVGQVTGTFADVLNWAGTSEDEFNKKLEACKTESERVNLVLQELSKQGLTKSAEDFRKNTSELVKNNEAQAKWQDTTARASKMVLPVMTALKNSASDVMNAFMDLVSGKISFNQFVGQIQGMVMNVLTSIGTLAPQMINEGIKMLSSLADGFVQGFPNLLAKILDLMQQLGDYISQQAPTWIQKGFEILTKLVDGIINAIPVLIAKVPQIVTTFANIINDNFPTILKKGAELLLRFIKGILSAIPTLIQNIPQIIQAIVSVIEAFNWMNLGKSIIDFFGKGIKSLTGWIGGRGKEIATSIWNSLTHLPQTLFNLGKNMISKMGSAITNSTGTVKGAVKGVFNAVVNGLKSLPSNMLKIGKDLVRGLWNGISDMTGWVIDKIKGFGDSILGGIKDFFGIHSPSKETYWIGEMLDKGLGNAIADGTKAVVKKAKNMSASVLEAMKSNLKEKIPIKAELVTSLKNKTANAIRTMVATGSNGMALAGATTSNVNNVTFNQYNTSPKPLDSLEIYRNGQKQAKQLKAWLGGKK